MKKLVLIISIVAILATGVFVSLYLLRERDRLEVGCARINISPVADGEIIPVPLGGYAGLRLADKIESDVYAICTSFRDKEGNTALVYSLDLLGLSYELADEITLAISEATSVPESNILLNCMHNHTAPETKSTAEASSVYNELLVEWLVILAKDAISDLSVCTRLYSGYLNIADLSYIRRDVDTGVDPSVPVARFVRRDKNDVLLINWSAHCDTYSSTDRTAVSSDYIGVLRDALEEQGDLSVSVQMGACADVNPSQQFVNNNEHTKKEALGRALADRIYSQLDQLERRRIVSRIDSVKTSVGAEIDHSKDDLVPAATRVRDLYYADRMEEYKAKCAESGIANVYEAASILSRSRSSRYEDVRLRAVSIGNLAFAAAPYEMFAINGAKIKEDSSFDTTFVMGYTHGREGYIAADHAYESGGYEVYSCDFAQGSAELFASTLSDMLTQLYSSEACRHSFVTMTYDEEYHRLKCSLCDMEPAHPSRHIFDEDYVCEICDEHIHKKRDLSGFSGITMSCIGSSTTQGAGIERPYVDIVEELLGLKATYNYGVSWSTVGHKESCDCDHPYLPDDYNHDPMVYRYNEIESTDIIFVYGGLNDFGMELPLGTLEDETPHTFYGALNMLALGLQREYPDSYVFMATSPNYFDGYTNEDGVTWAEYNEAIREVCRRHSIDCLDLYALPFNRLVDTFDYIHPTQEFTTKVLAPTIAEFIRNNFPRYYYYRDACLRCDEGERVEYENLFVDTVENHGRVCTYDLSTKEFIEKESKWYSYTLINVEDIEEIRFAFSEDNLSVAWSYFFYNKDNICVGGANITTGLVDVYAAVPSDAVYVGVLYNPRNQYGVYKAA